MGNKPPKPKLDMALYNPQSNNNNNINPWMWVSAILFAYICYSGLENLKQQFDQCKQDVVNYGQELDRWENDYNGKVNKLKSCQMEIDSLKSLNAKCKDDMKKMSEKCADTHVCTETKCKNLAALREFDLLSIWPSMKEQGWTDIDDWAAITEKNLREMNVVPGEIEKFKRLQKELDNNKQSWIDNYISYLADLLAHLNISQIVDMCKTNPTIQGIFHHGSQ